MTGTDSDTPAADPGRLRCRDRRAEALKRGRIPSTPGQQTSRTRRPAYVSGLAAVSQERCRRCWPVVHLAQSSSNLTKYFLTRGNMANLPTQAGPTILIAMGLVFVLLLGEIDLSAGTAGRRVRHDDGPGTHGGRARRPGHGALKDGMYGAVLHRHLARARGSDHSAHLAGRPSSSCSTFVVMVTHLGEHVWRSACSSRWAFGTAIGCITGFLVARVGIPSFVVTLAFFLAWQGIILEQFAGSAGGISGWGRELLPGHRAGPPQHRPDRRLADLHHLRRGLCGRHRRPARYAAALNSCRPSPLALVCSCGRFAGASGRRAVRRLLPQQEPANEQDRHTHSRHSVGCSAPALVRSW